MKLDLPLACFQVCYLCGGVAAGPSWCSGAHRLECIAKNKEEFERNPLQAGGFSYVQGVLVMYKVFHQLADLSLVDLDLRCSTILPGCLANSAEIPFA